MTKMTFEELEADWAAWDLAEAGSQDLADIYRRNQHLSNADFSLPGKLIVVCHCIILVYD